MAATADVTNGGFRVERVVSPAGEGDGVVDDGTYFISMADSGGAFIEWSADDSRKRTRNRVVSGDIWAWPPGQTWWTRRESAKTCIQLSLSSSWLEEVTRARIALQPQIRLRDELLAQMLRTLAALPAAPSDDPTTALYRESLVVTLVLHLVTRYGQGPSAEGLGQRGVAPLPSARVRAISEYVSDHLSEKIALTDLATLAGLSASQFSLRFRETMGQTPHQFVTSLRVDRARELLVTGEHTPADVASLTGFADQSHLTRQVRRAVGVTPGALIRNGRNGRYLRIEEDRSKSGDLFKNPV